MGPLYCLMTPLHGDSFPSSLLGAREWGDESVGGSFSGVGGGSWVVQCFSNFDKCQPPGGFVKAQIIPPGLPVVLVWGAARECALLTCSQELLLLLVWGPC